MANTKRLRSLGGVKWSRYGPDVLPAWVADMDFDQAPAIKQAMRSMVETGDLGYHFDALDSLTDTWLDWQERNHQWRPPRDEVWQFTGALHGAGMVMSQLTRPGDGIVIFSPIYAPFRDAIIHGGRRVVDVPLDDGTWRLNAPRFEAALDPDTRVVLFCQPHNPTGRIFDRDELGAFADVVERHDLTVVSDEVWADLAHDPHSHLPLALADQRLPERTITLGSASKAFNLAGLRCALAHVGSPTTRAALEALPGHALGGPSSISALAAVAAWTESDDWLAKTRAEIAERLDQVVRRLSAEVPEVGFTVPESTYLVWLDFRRTTLGDNPAKVLLKKAGVALDPGLKFGAQGAGHARLNIATSEQILDQILDRVTNAILGGVTP
ncbi:MAG: MalY/PatB family protein [Acidimicrobiales bacterium]